MSRLAVVMVVAAFTMGCWHNPTHCQSGAKHGTQCYTQAAPGDPPMSESNDDDDEKSSPRNEPDPTTPR